MKTFPRTASFCLICLYSILQNAVKTSTVDIIVALPLRTFEKPNCSKDSIVLLNLPPYNRWHHLHEQCTISRTVTIPPPQTISKSNKFKIRYAEKDNLNQVHYGINSTCYFLCKNEKTIRLLFYTIGLQYPSLCHIQHLVTPYRAIYNFCSPSCA